MNAPSAPSLSPALAPIDAALLSLMGSGAVLTHDAVAAQAGISRRTVYRRYPDQKALRARVWELLSPPQPFERDLENLLNGGLAEQFAKFDAEAEAMTVTMASAEGRAIRNQRKDQRTAYYRAVFGPALAGLPEPRLTQTLAVLQLLCSGFAWREMRDQWDLDGTASADACVAAIRAILGAARDDARGVD